VPSAHDSILSADRSLYSSLARFFHFIERDVVKADEHALDVSEPPHSFVFGHAVVDFSNHPTEVRNRHAVFGSFGAVAKRGQIAAIDIPRNANALFEVHFACPLL